MAQRAGLDVAHASERIDQVAIGIAGDRIDGEVAPAQVVFQGHRWIGMHGEAGMPARRLAFGARQRVFLAAMRMQEHREVAPDLPVARIEHLLRRCADHDVVVVARGQAEQRIAHGAADQVDLCVVRERLHAPMMPERVSGGDGPSALVSRAVLVQRLSGAPASGRRRSCAVRPCGPACARSGAAHRR